MKPQTISSILTATAMLLVAPSISTAQERGSVQGVIHDAYGKPLAGAFVKLKNDERRLTFMVVTRDQGQFEAKDLPPGQYRVQGVAGANQSDWFTKVQVTNGGSARPVGRKRARADPTAGESRRDGGSASDLTFGAWWPVRR